MTALEPVPDSAPDTRAFLEFAMDHLQPKRGSRVLWSIAYEHYSSWWEEQADGGPALSVGEFGEAMRDFCDRAKISVGKTRGRIYCANVRLVDPTVKALAGPGRPEAEPVP